MLQKIQALGGDYRTPCYCCDTELLDNTLRAAKEAAGNYFLHYAIKANADPQILRRMVIGGFGADTVSGGEVELALQARFRYSSIFLAGVGKSDDELRLAISNKLGCINVESVEEIPVIQQIAASLGKTANIALRINPGIDAHTHRDITTGTDDDKFGIPVSQLADAIALVKSSNNLKFKGLHFHIGSQITDFAVLERLCGCANGLVTDFASQGLKSEILDLGGGLGIDYQDPENHPIADFPGYFGTFRRHLQLPHYTRVHFELGRSLVGPSTALLTRVMLVKTTGSGKRLCVIDAGFTELIRPALYGATHRVYPVSTSGNGEPFHGDIVGPVCESTDVMARDVNLPPLRRGDILMFSAAGAYGETMSMHYNCRSAAPKIYI